MTFKKVGLGGMCSIINWLLLWWSRRSKDGEGAQIEYCTWPKSSGGGRWNTGHNDQTGIKPTALKGTESISQRAYTLQCRRLGQNEVGCYIKICPYLVRYMKLAYIVIPKLLASDNFQWPSFPGPYHTKFGVVIAGVISATGTPYGLI